jgi:hypothetical protein
MPKAASSKKGVIHRKLSPDNGLALPKVKLRPRGKPFAKNHSIGAEFRFKKGEPSKNPKGRPKSAAMREALRKKLASEVSLPRVGRTFAEKLVDRWVDLAMAGNAAAISAICDNAEGRPTVSIDMFDNRIDPFKELISAMHRRNQITGPPEESSSDYTQPLLNSGNEEEVDGQS